MTAVRRTGYSALQIALHWVIAALVIFQVVFGESMVEAVEAAEEGEALGATDQLLAGLHYWVGLAILALVAVRLVVRMVSGAPPAVDDGLAGKAAAGLHLLFYVLLVAAPVSGLLGYYLGDPWGELHQLAKPAFIVLVAIHAAAALYHAFVLRDATLRRMMVPARD